MMTPLSLMFHIIFQILINYEAVRANPAIPLPANVPEININLPAKPDTPNAPGKPEDLPVLPVDLSLIKPKLQVGNPNVELPVIPQPANLPGIIELPGIPVGPAKPEDVPVVPVDLSLIKPKSGLVENRATTDCGCGYGIDNPPPGGWGRIVGGSEAKANSLPYQVKLSIKMGLGSAMCGGTLINKRYVLTAAHCVKSGSTTYNDITVTAGYHKNGVNNHLNQVFKATPIAHAGYNERTSDNDVALLKLDRDVSFNEYVRAACLPNHTNRLYENQNAVVSGWGTTSSGGSTSAALKETTVQIVPQSHSSCRAYGTLPLSQMCAYTPRTDSCQGDSGGPLVLKEDGRYTVVGVVSYGNGCAVNGYAGVYARVTNFMPWINANSQDGWCTGSNPAPAPGPAPAPAPTTTPAPIANPLLSLFQMLFGGLGK